MAEQTSRLAIIIDSTGAERNADSLASSLAKMTQAGEHASSSANKVKKATKEEAEALSNLLDRIDPVNSALNKLDQQQQELSKFKAKGMIDTETFNVYSKQIENTRNRLTGFSEQLAQTGMSAKQTAAAMRMVPAQLTDIVVSLQGGQAPLTVLLQQGGQLKDMFGGIVPAAKALGGYVLSLVNPFTISAAAVGVLTYAIYQNRQEIDAATKIATTSLGASGDEAERLALNMVAISSKTGQAIDDVGSMFIVTKDGATEAINKLIDVGFSYDEARQKVAQYKDSANFTALNADIDQHRREILKIGDSWTAAAIKVKNYYTAADKGKQNVALGGAIDPTMRFIGQAIDLQSTMNTLTIEGNKAVAESVDWINKEFLSSNRVASAEVRLKDARAQARKISSSGNKEAIQQASELIAIREKELDAAKKAENRKPSEKAYTEDAGTRMLDQLRQQQQVLLSQADTGDKIGTQAQALIKWEQQLSDLKSKVTLTADQKSLLANADIITAQLQQNAAIERQIQSREKLLALDKARDDIARTITNRQSQYGAEEFMASGGMSQYEQQQYSQRFSLEQSYNDKITQLRQQRTSATSDIAREEIDQEIELQRQALNTELQNYDDHIARMNAARGSFSAGANRAWREYLDSAANVSAMSQQLFTSAFSGMEDAIVKFATTGKASFKDFATSVISDLARIAARQAIAGIGSSIFGSVLSAGVSAATGSVGSTPSGAYDNAAAGLKFNAKGGVYDSPSLSNYSNGIYNSPQFFAFAKGAGVFAEAGPEAIMPLARGANGSLGVRAIGASSSAPAISIGDINVTISGESQSAEVSNQSTADSARQLQGIILRTVTDWAKREITPGGILYKKA